MNFTKTRIWGSPLVPPASQEEGARNELHNPVHVEAPAIDLSKTVVSPPPSLSQTTVSPAAVGERARVSPRSGTRIMNLATLLPSLRRSSGSGPVIVPDLADEPLRAPTRVLPIEQLAKTTVAPAEANFEPPDEPQASQLSPAVKPRVALNPLRVVTICLAIAAAAMWAVAMFKEPQRASQDTAAVQGMVMPARAEQAVVKEAVAVADDPATVREPSALPAAEASQHPLARRAVDALAHGDDSGAQALYQQLATQHPEQPAYAEAARILHARLREVP